VTEIGSAAVVRGFGVRVGRVEGELRLIGLVTGVATDGEFSEQLVMRVLSPARDNRPVSRRLLRFIGLFMRNVCSGLPDRGDTANRMRRAESLVQSKGCLRLAQVM
jgi:hypothetical protein